MTLEQKRKWLIATVVLPLWAVMFGLKGPPLSEPEILTVAVVASIGGYFLFKKFCEPETNLISLAVGAFFFTGVLGLKLLLTFQSVAFGLSASELPRSLHGKPAVIAAIVKLIGKAYQVSLDAMRGDQTHSWVVVAICSIVSIGLCEEFTKLIPVLWAVHGRRCASFRSAAFVGALSGLGFGIFESWWQFSTPGEPLSHATVRFFGCAYGHAIWTMFSSVSLFAVRQKYHEAVKRSLWLAAGLVGASVFAAAIFHGLYDAFLFRGFSLYAGIVPAGAVWVALRISTELFEKQSAVAASELMPLGRSVGREPSSRLAAGRSIEPVESAQVEPLAPTMPVRRKRSKRTSSNTALILTAVCSVLAIWFLVVVISQERQELIPNPVAPTESRAMPMGNAADRAGERFGVSPAPLARSTLPTNSSSTLDSTGSAPGSVESAVEEAVANATAGDLDAALAKLDSIVMKHPDCALAYRKRGDVWIWKTEYSKAISDYDRSIRVDPNEARAYNNRGFAWLNTGDSAKAMADYNAALAIDPQLVVALGNRADLWLMGGNHEEAIRGYDQVIELTPKDADAYSARGRAWAIAGDAERTIKDCNEAIRLDNRCTVAYLVRANVLQFQGDLKNAWNDYKAVLAYEPASAAAHLGLGRVWGEKGKIDRGIEEVTEAIRLDPQNALAHAHRADMKLTKGSISDARADAERALQLDPSISIAYRCRGQIRFRAEDYENALADYNEATRLQPDDYLSQYGRGELRLKLGVRDHLTDFYAAAVQDFTNALALRPNFVIANRRRGLAYILVQNYRAAIADYRRVLDVDPKDDHIREEIDRLVNLLRSETNQK